MRPNAGVLYIVGSLGVWLNRAVAFNIRVESGADTAVFGFEGAFHTVDLAMGKATSKGDTQGLNGRFSQIGWGDGRVQRPAHQPSRQCRGLSAGAFGVQPMA